MYLLTTYTHDSELQVITEPQLIFALYKSPQQPLTFPACCVLTNCSMATASNSGDSSASRPQVPLSQAPLKNSSTANSTIKIFLLILLCRAKINTLLQTLLLITCWHGPHRKHPVSTVSLLRAYSFRREHFYRTVAQ
jgi:hypothetical protein